jgi:NADPH:quinone reductase-like Zn-dependent oxidoreductase
MLAYHAEGAKFGMANLLPRAAGDALQQRLLAWLDAGRIRPIVGRAASWRELPAELERLESRATIGRSVLDWRTG